MAQLFSRRADRRLRVVLILGAALIVGTPLALLAWARTPVVTGQHHSVAQPLRFSHPLHVNAMRISCTYCHAGAERAAMAGLPPSTACVNCHSALMLDAAPLAPVLSSLRTGTPVQWQRVTTLPDFVYFNHVVHTRNGIGCERCHGQVNMMDPVEQAAPMTMAWCVQCHRASSPQVRGRSLITCTTCHR